MHKAYRQAVHNYKFTGVIMLASELTSTIEWTVQLVSYLVTQFLTRVFLLTELFQWRTPTPV